MKSTRLILTGITLALCSTNPVWADKAQHKSARFAAELSGAQEVVTTQITNASGATVSIPLGPLATGAYGKAHFILSADQSMLEYHFEASGFGSTMFMAHIHLGPPGANGSIMLWLYGDKQAFPNSPRNDGPFSGMMSGVLTSADLTPIPGAGINTFADAVANILRGNAYVNLHTSANPAGEIRGQIEAKHRHGHHDD